MIGDPSRASWFLLNTTSGDDDSAHDAATTSAPGEQQRRSLIDNDRGSAVPGPNCGDGGAAVPCQNRGSVNSALHAEEQRRITSDKEHDPTLAGSAVPYQSRGGDTRRRSFGGAQPPISITCGVDIFRLPAVKQKTRRPRRSLGHSSTFMTPSFSEIGRRSETLAERVGSY